jgi:FkbM family methyltransferase
MSLSSITVNTPNGPRPFHFRPGTSDDDVIKQVFRIKEYAFMRFRQSKGLARLLTAEAKAGRRPLIIDAGANIGAASVYFATQFPRARIVAIEPSSENLELLKLNTEGLDIEIIHGALCPRPGHVEFIDPGDGFWGFRTGAAADAASETAVEAVALNEIYAANAKECFPFLAKIDIEGAEGDVFSERVEWVDQTAVIAIELHDWLMPGKGTSQSFLQCVSARKRDFLILGENVFSVRVDGEAAPETTA